jgi:hypothetical protein
MNTRRDQLSLADGFTVVPENRRPETEIFNPQPMTLNPQTPCPKPQTLNLNRAELDPNLQTPIGEAASQTQNLNPES